MVRLPYRSKTVWVDHPPGVVAFCNELQALQERHGVTLTAESRYGDIAEGVSGHHEALVLYIGSNTRGVEDEDGLYTCPDCWVIRRFSGGPVGDFLCGEMQQVEVPWTPEELELHHEVEAKALRERQAREKAEVGRRCDAEDAPAAEGDIRPLLPRFIAGVRDGGACGLDGGACGWSL